MAHVVRIFKTVGSFEGKSVVLGGCHFVDGKFRFEGSERDADNLGKYLQRCWQVVPDTAGSAEETAQANEPAADEVPNVAQQLGNERLAAALRQLDPENDDHWTKLGKPTMSAVEQFYGSAAVTRDEVEAAIPGFSRDAARAAKAGAGAEQE